MATWTRLRTSGNWGLRLVGNEATAASMGKVGTVRVNVVRSDGTRAIVTVGKVVHRTYDGVVIAEVFEAPAVSSAWPTAPRAAAVAASSAKPTAAGVPANPVSLAALLGRDEDEDDGTFSLADAGDDDASDEAPVVGPVVAAP